MKGVKFLMRDGSWDYYDPVREEDFKETEFEYILNMSYTYEIDKKDVVRWEWYELKEEGDEQ